jgi:hypothetical protein
VGLDRVELSPDGSSVLLSLVGAPPISAGRPCGAEYQFTAEVKANVLEVAAFETANRAGQCQMTELVCCERTTTVEISPPFAVDTVSDAGHPRNPIRYLTRPPGLVELVGLPEGWSLRRESGDWGATWNRTYAPFDDLQQGASDTLEFTFNAGRPLQDVVEPEVLQPPVEVNGAPAVYERWDELGEILLAWQIGSDVFHLLAEERNFSIEELIHLAESAVVAD